ncbi:MAG: hypothetical protein A2Z28_02080 [Chloroflexi bacterium RBG_16_51_9]|nr:MAG: hypothetical protein A2Z28_02080 [Chloroflexi bacterium RBG_16_51_9]
MDAAQPSAEMVAVKGDRILLVAGNENLDEVRGAGTRVIDCAGKTVVPGFNDAHCHVFSLIRQLLSIDISPSAVDSIEDIKVAIAQKTQQTPRGNWVTATGYNDFYLAEKRHPTRRDMDEVAPDHPVILLHRSLHACVLNSLALALAGISGETEEPPGATIGRDLDSGEPDGVLFEMVGHISKVLPSLSEEEITSGIALANKHYLSQGITSLQDATVTNDLERWQLFRNFKDEGLLKSRVYMMFGFDAMSQFREAGLAGGFGDEGLRLGGVKFVLTDAPGEIYPPQPELNQKVLEAHQAGFQVAIHAVQEETVEAAISALEYAHSQVPVTDSRHRIEHCSECPSDLLWRLKRLQTVIVTQPPFLYYSGERYLAVVPPERLSKLYRIKSFLDSGLVVAGSSDSPIASDNPLVGIYTAVTRKAETGQQVLPEERISVSQALAMYTINAAYASFEEGIKGSITPGKLADMVVLDTDPTRSLLESIKDIKVEMTILGGEVVWEG